MKSFYEKIYSQLKKVPSGKVTTYKVLAHSINSKAYQAVGNAMRHNPYFPIVPCHRCIKSNGFIGGFGGKIKGKKIQEKISLLKKEGIEIKNNKIDLKKYLYKF